MAAKRPASKPRTKSTPAARVSRRSIGIAVCIAIVITAALVTVALLSRKSSNSTAQVTTPTANLSGVPQVGRVLGSQAAKVKLIEFTDPQCPFCRQYALDVSPAIVENYVRTGKVKSEYRAFPFIGEDSFRGARFLLAAGLQNKLWQLQEALYRAQGGENSGWLTDALVRQVADEIPGLDVARLFHDAQSA